jgi:hypothetical protein
MHLARFRPRRRSSFTAALLLAAALLVAPVATPTEPAHATFGISTAMGIDGCDLHNNIPLSQKFWNGTPYYNFGVYIGGSVALCPATRSFVTALRSNTYAMKWRLMLIWVGPQAPCNLDYSPRMSSNTTTAYNQGVQEAANIYNKLLEFGLSTVDTPVIYDLESYSDFHTTACENAVKSFMRGYVTQMHVAPAQKAGVYGSTCASYLAGLHGISPRPDFISGANWSGNKNTNVMSCINSSWWIASQRHKQYRGDHNETWNGGTASVDSDCSNAPIYPGPEGDLVVQGCV